MRTLTNTMLKTFKKPNISNVFFSYLLKAKNVTQKNLLKHSSSRSRANDQSQDCYLQKIKIKKKQEEITNKKFAFSRII